MPQATDEMGQKFEMLFNHRGETRAMKIYLNSLLLVICFLVAQLPAQDANRAAKGIEGYWFGKLNFGTVKLRYGFNITKNDNGSLKATFDCPEGSEKDVPIDEVEFRDTTLKLRLKSRKASFEGKFDAAANEIVGKWNQAGRSLDLTLSLTDRAAVQDKRPQHPKPPYPYVEEEVTYTNRKAGVQLAGTLTLPRGDGPFPAVLLITGAGPQDRDETSFEHKPFLVLADHLTRQGIAALRVDKRGVGRSTGSSDTHSLGPSAATSEDFAEDVAAGVAFLKSRKEINHRHIGLLGHSEGGMVAPMVAAQSNDIAFIVLLAAPGVTGVEFSVRQKQLLWQALGASEKALKRRVDLAHQAFAIIKTEKDDETAAQRIRELFRREARKLEDAGEKDPEISQSAADVFIVHRQSRWLRFFISYDPQTALAKVRCPVLAIHGERLAGRSEAEFTSHSGSVESRR